MVVDEQGAGAGAGAGGLGLGLGLYMSWIEVFRHNANIRETPKVKVKIVTRTSHIFHIPSLQLTAHSSRHSCIRKISIII